MNNMFLCFRSLGKSIEKFGEMLATPKFWYIIIAIIGLIILIVNCLKYPKVGKWVLFSVFYLGFLCLTAYSCVQLNIFYKTKGGIIGQISGIFENNQVEIVDDITYEFKNTELIQIGDTNKYSSSVSVPEIMNLENGVKYQVLVNDVPCGYADNNEDYIIAKYNYIFFDENFNSLLQDTLTINVAFYSNSTSFSVSTEGGAKAVKYWNYYFNKNSFVVKLVGKTSTIKDTDYSSSEDVLNHSKVTYKVNDEIYCVKVFKNGSPVDLIVPDVEHFEYWTLNGVKVDTLTVTEDVVLDAKITQYYSVKYVITDDYSQSFDIKENDLAYNPDILDRYSVDKTNRWVFDYWTLDGNQIDTSSYVVTKDLTFIAVGHIEFLINITSSYFDYSIYYKSNKPIGDLSKLFSSGFVAESYLVNNIEIDPNNYIVTQSFTIVVNGYKKALDTLTSTSDYECYKYLPEEAINLIKNVSSPFVYVDNDYTYYFFVYPYTSYRLNRFSMEVASFNNPDGMNGFSLFNDGDNLLNFYNNRSYLFDSNNLTWRRLDNLPAFFSKDVIWKIGNDYYSLFADLDVNHRFCYKYDKSTMTWSQCELFDGILPLYGKCWTDGINTYFSGSCVYENKIKDFNLVFDESLNQWIEKKWNGFDPVDGKFIWHDDNNIYYSDRDSQYILNVATSTWIEYTWTLPDELSSSTVVRFVGSAIWFDGFNYYLGDGKIVYKFS